MQPHMLAARGSQVHSKAGDSNITSKRSDTLANQQPWRIEDMAHYWKWLNNDNGAT